MRGGINSNQVRIIGGRHRGRRLRFPDGRGLRPTADRVRETLFNWLRNDIAGTNCLDLFAGSGALGFEALSRGAAKVVFVERAGPPVRQLQQNAELLGEAESVQIVRRDARAYLKRAPDRPFDLVFLDPPFADRLLAPAMSALNTVGWMTPSAIVYAEQDISLPWPQAPDNWQIYREGDAGQAAYRLYCVAAEDAQA